MILRNNNLENNLKLNFDNDFNINLNWSEEIEQYEKDVIYSVINPIENFELNLYKHKNYIFNNYNINELYLKFYFKSNTYISEFSSNTFEKYEIVNNKNSFKNSFFKIDYFITNNDEEPNNTNKRLINSERVYANDTEIMNDINFKSYINFPLIKCDKVKNNNVFNFFWLNKEQYTFWISTKFFNAKNGIIYDFINNQSEINDEKNFYYKLIIDNDFTYQLTDYSNNRVGTKMNPINFYERI